MQHMQPSPARNPYPQMGMMPAGGLGISAGAGISGMNSMEMQSSSIQPRPGRLPRDRPIVKLSVSLIDTYKDINRVSFCMAHVGISFARSLFVRCLVCSLAS